MQAKQLTAQVEAVSRLKPDVYLLSFFSAYLARQSRPGNFIHLKIAPAILRRPFSIHRIKKNRVDILFRVRGRGTKILSRYRRGAVLDIIGPLGKGFRLSRPAAANILVSGGMGVAPLVFLAERINKAQTGKVKTRNLVLLGAKNKKALLAAAEFARLKFKTAVATDDGSDGFKGSVVDLLTNRLSAVRHQPSANIYACGPKAMFLEMAKVLRQCPRVNCQVSFEQFMGCGIGACCGCSIETKQGYKKVCKDGPVFNLKDIW